MTHCQDVLTSGLEIHSLLGARGSADGVDVDDADVVVVVEGAVGVVDVGGASGQSTRWHVVDRGRVAAVVSQGKSCRPRRTHGRHCAS